MTCRLRAATRARRECRVNILLDFMKLLRLFNVKERTGGSPYEAKRNTGLLFVTLLHCAPEPRIALTLHAGCRASFIIRGVSLDSCKFDRPVQIHGDVVATVRMRQLKPVPDEVESRFLTSQYWGIASVAAALLLLALMGAWWAARRWVRPLLAVQVATTRIAHGEFDIRLNTARSNEIGDVMRNVNASSDLRDVSDRAIDSHIKNIRRKIVAVDPGCECIASVYGVGYRFDAPER